MRGNVNSKQLLALIETFRDNPSSVWKNSALVQLLLATYQALESAKGLMWDELLAAEKIFFLTATKYPESLLKQLVDLLSSPGKTEYKIQDIVCFSLLAYSLAGTGHGISAQEEDLFERALVSRVERNQNDLIFLRSIFQSPSLSSSSPPSSSSSSSSSSSPGLVSPAEVVSVFVRHLKILQHLRSHLQQHK